MKTIWKFTLEHGGETIEMPQGAVILTAREQGESICLWAEVDTQALYERRSFMVYGTGHQMPNYKMKYIGTASLEGGALIFHVYEEV